MTGGVCFLIKTESSILNVECKSGKEIRMDRLTDLMHRRVAYTMTDEPEKTYTGTVERDSYGRPYIQDEADAAAIVYDTGILQTVEEI